MEQTAEQETQKLNEAIHKQNSHKKIFFVEDHPLIVNAMSKLVEKNLGYEVCGHADIPDEAERRIARERPDIVVIDISLRGKQNGLELLKTVTDKYPDIIVVVMTMHENEMYAIRALQLGAKGYLLKDEEPEELIASIRQVMAGNTVISTRIAGRVIENFLKPQVSDNNPLSAREQEIFTLIGEGLTTREISSKLDISISTVETHKTHIKEKLNIKSNGELVKRAIEQKIALNGF